MVDVGAINRVTYNPSAFVDAQAQHLRQQRENPQPAEGGAAGVNYEEAQ